MKTEPQKEHAWLEQMVGEWEYESESIMGPGQPPIKSKGTESVRSLGLWVLCEGRSQMPDGNPATTIFTFGYDPVKKRFVGTFIGSMMANLWVYEGQLDGNVLNLDVDGPSFTDPTKTVKYRDAFEIKSSDHRVLTASRLGEDGQWHSFMTAHYRRTR